MIVATYKLPFGEANIKIALYELPKTGRPFGATYLRNNKYFLTRRMNGDTFPHMEVEFDRANNDANIAAHGLSFAAFEGFDALPAVTVDDRKAYGETRYRAFGRIEGAGHCLAFTIRDGRIRAISLRRAHEKEMRRHGQ